MKTRRLGFTRLDGLFWYLWYRWVRYELGRTARYANVLKEVFGNRPRRIMEIGVHWGIRSAQMLRVARAHHPPADLEFFGFDLFEDLSDNELAREFSKRPITARQVRAKLDRLGGKIELHQGYSRDTLPEFVDREGDQGADFVFLDGGHSAETVRSDWRYVQELMHSDTVVLFDDYYPMNQNHPELQNLGCRGVVERIEPTHFEVEILQPYDRFQKPWGELVIQMVRVTRKQ